MLGIASTATGERGKSVSQLKGATSMPAITTMTASSSTVSLLSNNHFVMLSALHGVHGLPRRFRGDLHSAAWRHRSTGRSEERRVGKECRGRWAADRERKKTRRGGRAEHTENSRQRGETGSTG